MENQIKSKFVNLAALFRSGRRFLIIIVSFYLFADYGLRASDSFLESPTTRDFRIINALYDLDYVGNEQWDDNYDEMIETDQIFKGYCSLKDIPEHSDSKLPFPDQLQTNRQYIFHNSKNIDDDFLLDMVRARLHSNGVTLHFAHPVLYPYAGRMKFFIRFQYKNCQGFIFNRDSHSMDGNDYILVFRKMN